MTTITVHGDTVTLSGSLPAVGQPLPSVTVTTNDLDDVALADLAGSRLVLNIFPSVDTGVCASQLRAFNKAAAGLENTTVIGVSKDLPFAQARFCGAEGIENVATYSAFRSDFGDAFGVTMTDGPLRGLLARAVIVTDADGRVVYSELVPEVGQEPDYEAALAALDA